MRCQGRCWGNGKVVLDVSSHGADVRSPCADGAPAAKFAKELGEMLESMQF